VKRIVQTTGLLVALLYGAVIVWLYVRQPRSLQDIKTQAAVEVNVYSVKPENFAEALQEFNARQYAVAIAQFKIADPAERDPTTQFYIAYSYYMLGRGRFSDDDEMFRQGLAAIDRCIANAPNGIFEIGRADLEFDTAWALRKRLEEGLEVTGSDFNPLNWFKNK
jgi:hypothetical protein